jgi:hypothetical protein
MNKMITQETSNELLQWLSVMLDAVDYTADACRPNELIGAVLDQDVIRSAQQACINARKELRHEAV